VDAYAGAYEGAIAPSLESGVIPEAMARKLKEDIFVFSGFKTYQGLREASRLLRDEDGTVKPFNRFYNVFRTNLAIVRGTVLQVVAVAVRLKVLPFGGHFRRGLGEEIFRFQPMAVIILLDRRYIVVKTVERLHRPVFVAQQAGCLPQSLVGLESGQMEGL